MRECVSARYRLIAQRVIIVLSTTISTAEATASAMAGRTVRGGTYLGLVTRAWRTTYPPLVGLFLDRAHAVVAAHPVRRVSHLLQIIR